jgi:hypothetical protein
MLIIETVPAPRLNGPLELSTTDVPRNQCAGTIRHWIKVAAGNEIAKPKTAADCFADGNVRRVDRRLVAALDT